MLASKPLPLPVPLPLPKVNPNVLKAKNIKKEEEEEEEEDIQEEEEEEEVQDEEEEEDKENIGSKAPITYQKDDKSLFFATFIDGASFRALIEYLRLTTLEGTFLFSKDYITYQKEDESGLLMNDLKIKTYELIDYDFSSTNREISAHINLAGLRDKTRTVGKKEQLDIYKRSEEPSNFYIQVRSQEKGGAENPVFYCMKMKSVDVTVYKLPEYSRGKKNPNCTIYQSDFTKLCKALSSNKCSYIRIVGYEKGFSIQGYGSDNTAILVKEFGKCKVNSAPKVYATTNVFTDDKTIVKSNVAPPKLAIRDVDEISRFKIHSDIFKSFAKLNGFSPQGTIKVYIEKGLPLKLVVPVGSYGKLTILIRSAA